jgi:transposase
MGVDRAAFAGGQTAGETALRGVVEALLYLLRTASPWRLLPHDFPKRSTVQRYCYVWRAAGLWETINFLLLQQGRERSRSGRRKEKTPAGGHRGFQE